MKTFPSYTNVEPLGETLHAVTYRAHRKREPREVVIQVLKAAPPSLPEVARFKEQYARLRSAAAEGIVKVIEILEEEGEIALVLEDAGGLPLRAFLEGKFPLPRFLTLAIRLAGILGGLHREGISHRNITPDSILLDPETDAVQLTDFGLAAELTRQGEKLYHPRVIEEVLPYIPPEATGRMNRGVDYRADLYALGVTFYEMLTGAVPFPSRDPLEIIHAHIARPPAPPEALNPAVPRAVSDIIMKLLAKTAEARYQNSFGLQDDLKCCQDQLTRTGRIEPFPPGRRDLPLWFTPPEALVGRDEELATLREAFERVSRGAVEVMLVTGEAGTGKSRLVQELQKPVLGRRGYFISGKYDRLRRYDPYSSIVQAFQHLARQLLAESEERIQTWKARLLEALGASGRVITDLIPEIGHIIGPQPDVPELGPEETRNRFKMVFKNFLQVFADETHPVVLFLDDLQWADPASLDLIQTLITDRDLCFFFFIGAYRTTKDSTPHLLVLAMDTMREARREIKVLSLTPLGPEEVDRHLARFLRVAPAASAPLAEVLYDRTRGNPFFIHQLLRTLHERQYLVLDAAAGWRWDMEGIRQMEVRGDAMAFMAGRIAGLFKDWRDLLQVCACMGSQFDVEILAAAMDLPLEETLETLSALEKLGLVQYAGHGARFSHDLIQEAAYSLISPSKRETLHYRIGRRVMAMTPPEALAAKVFYIADQYNQAQGLIQTRHKKAAMVDLNLKAGLKARYANAHAAAAAYFKTGMAFLPEDAWQEQYELTYTLHMERMRCEYLARNFKASETLFADIVRNTRDKVDRAKACHMMITLYANMGKIREAIELGIESARIFNVYLSWKMGRWSVIRELILFRIKTRGRRLKDVLDLPLVTDEEKLWSTELLSSIGLPAYYRHNSLFAVTVIKGMIIGSDYGLPPASGFGNMALAVIIGSKLGKYRIARRLGELALQLDERIGERRYSCKTYFLFASMVLHWTAHLKESLPYYRRGYQFGIDAGDFIYCGHCITSANLSRIVMGDSIAEVLADHERHQGFITSLKDPLVGGQYEEITHFLLNLQGLTDSPFSLDTPDYRHEELIAAKRRAEGLLHLFHSLLLQEWINYFHGDHDRAYRIGHELDDLMEIPMGTFQLAEHFFYRCLSLLAVYAGKGMREKGRIWRTLKKRKKKMKQWAVSSPANYGAKYLLIEAETAGVKNRSREALDLYQQAVRAARENGYRNVEALAHERAARFCLEKGNEADGRRHLASAHEGYRRWGAKAKLQELEKEFPSLAEAPSTPGAN